MRRQSAVRENMVEIDAPGGRMRVFEAAGTTEPDGTVILFPDVLGLHDEVLGLVRKVAKRGYRCLAPDVYYRERKDAFRGVSELADMLAMGKRLRTESLVGDIRSLVSYANGNREGGRLATIGFCRGGSQAVLAAGVACREIVSAVAAYPTRLLQESADTSYSRWFPAMNGEIRILSPGSDELMPQADVERLAVMFDELGTRYQIRIYPNATHGWNFRSRPEYDAHADSDTWRVAFSTWDRLLRRGSQPVRFRTRWVVVGDRSAAGRSAHDDG